MALLVVGGSVTLGVVVPSPALIVHWSPQFLIGIALFQYRVGVMSAPATAITLVSLAVATAALLGPVIAAIGILTAVAIVAVDLSPGGPYRIFACFGGLSHSLYLVHVPVGGRILNLGVRYAHSGPARWAFLAAAVVASMVVACLLAVVVERPAQRFAARQPLHRRGFRSNGSLPSPVLAAPASISGR